MLRPYQDTAWSLYPPAGAWGTCRMANVGGMVLDFALVRNGEKTIHDLAMNLDRADLHRLTDEMIDRMLSLIENATDEDVVCVPEDPQANDKFASSADQVSLPWTLGHVIVHTSASAEECAAQACALARGVLITGRSRYETPWEMVKTIAQVRQRLEESRRMRHALLNAWPEEPHLEVVYVPKRPGAQPLNAVTYFISGLNHDDAHLEQIQKIMNQTVQA